MQQDVGIAERQKGEKQGRDDHVKQLSIQHTHQTPPPHTTPPPHKTQTNQHHTKTHIKPN